MRALRRAPWLLLIAVFAGASYAQTTKIAGTGAVSCGTFLKDIAMNPISEREYYSWAQGYMSGILVRAPAGIDDNLDLIARAFPVIRQLQFFRDYCAARPDHSYADAAESLYKRLRKVAAPAPAGADGPAER